jgi:hypothetical protein
MSVGLAKATVALYQVALVQEGFMTYIMLVNGGAKYVRANGMCRRLSIKDIRQR